MSNSAAFLGVQLEFFCEAFSAYWNFHTADFSNIDIPTLTYLQSSGWVNFAAQPIKSDIARYS